MRALQSLAVTHVFESTHELPHAPPQSTSDSVPFFTPSKHVATAHVFAVQTPDPQSVPAEHALPDSHLAAHEPPQSTSDSVPFLMASPHGGPRHNPAEQTPPMQSTSVEHEPFHG